MAEETKDGKISISGLPRQIISSVAFKLEVPNFFTLPEYDGNDFHEESSSFEFANATWCFRFTSPERDETETADSFKRFCFSLVMLKSEDMEPLLLFYVIALWDADDKVYSCVTGETDFSDEKVSLLTICDNEEPNYDNRETLILSVQLIFIDLSNEEADQDTMDRSASLSQDFKDMFLNGQDHNLIFTVRDKQIRVHRDVLRARSEVFRSMLNHDMLEKNSGGVDVPDCDPEAFEQLVLYLYTGKVEKLDESDMFGLYYAADKYNVADLREKCSTFIKKSLSVTNVCEAIALASKHSDEDMLNCAINYFTENANDIFPTVEWQLFLKENSTVANELIIKSFNKVKITESQ